MYFSPCLLYALQFIKINPASQKKSFTSPPFPQYMPGKYVLNKIRPDSRYLASECHLASICSLDGIKVMNTQT